MEIKHFAGSGKGRFEAIDDGTRAGEMLYKAVSPTQISIFHTEVAAEFEGKGIGGKLVAAAVEYARENGIQLSATCPYAHHVLAKRSEYSDVFVDE